MEGDAQALALLEEVRAAASELVQGNASAADLKRMNEKLNLITKLATPPVQPVKRPERLKDFNPLSQSIARFLHDLEVLTPFVQTRQRVQLLVESITNEALKEWIRQQFMGNDSVNTEWQAVKEAVVDKVRPQQESFNALMMEKFLAAHEMTDRVSGFSAQRFCERLFRLGSQIGLEMRDQQLLCSQLVAKCHQDIRSEVRREVARLPPADVQYDAVRRIIVNEALLAEAAWRDQKKGEKEKRKKDEKDKNGPKGKWVKNKRRKAQEEESDDREPSRPSPPRKFCQICSDKGRSVIAIRSHNTNEHLEPNQERNQRRNYGREQFNGNGQRRPQDHRQQRPDANARMRQPRDPLGNPQRGSNARLVDPNPINGAGSHYNVFSLAATMVHSDIAGGDGSVDWVQVFRGKTGGLSTQAKQWLFRTVTAQACAALLFIDLGNIATTCVNAQWIQENQLWSQVKPTAKQIYSPFASAPTLSVGVIQLTIQFDRLAPLTVNALVVESWATELDIILSFKDAVQGGLVVFEQDSQSDFDGIHSVRMSLRLQHDNEWLGKRMTVVNSIEHQPIESVKMLAIEAIILDAKQQNQQQPNNRPCTHPSSKVALGIKEGAVPKFVPQYPLELKFRSFIRRQISEWQKRNIIVSADPQTKWNSPMLVIPKMDADGNITDWRLCIDFRHTINPYLSSDDTRGGIPTIEEIAQFIRGCDIISEIDIEDAYLVMELSYEDSVATTFRFDGKAYRFTRPIFGIASVPKLFNQFISEVFRDLPFVKCYFDNIFVAQRGDDHEDHARKVKTVIRRLTQHAIRVKWTKSNIGYKGLKSLGSIVSAEGTAMSPAKMLKLQHWPEPRSFKELQRFLGLVNYMAKYVPHLAAITAPWRALMHRRKGVFQPGDWTLECSNAFKQLSIAMATAPVLSHPRHQLPFHIMTDASNVGVGTVLFQYYDERFHFISFDSSAFTDAQRKYSVPKRELFGIVFALRKYHRFVFGHKFNIYTDSAINSRFFDVNKLDQRAKEWFAELMQYDFKLIHIAREHNFLADWYSNHFRTRAHTMPSRQIDNAETVVQEPLQVSHETPEWWSTFVASGIESQLLRRSNRRAERPLRFRGHNEAPSDPASPEVNSPVAHNMVIAEHAMGERVRLRRERRARNTPEPHAIYEGVNEDVAVDRQQAQQADPQEARIRPELVRNEEVIRYPNRTIRRVIKSALGKECPAPQKQHELMVEYHDKSSHAGANALYDVLFNQGYYWPTMRESCREHTGSCVQCLRRAIGRDGYHPITSITAMYPGDHYAIDLAGPMKPASPSGYTHILVLVDLATRFLILRALRAASGREVGAALKGIFDEFGSPQTIQSDNGPEFVNQLVRTILRSYESNRQIQHNTTLPYNPQANGLAEVYVREVKEALFKRLYGNPHFEVFLSGIMRSLNQRLSPITRSTPFSLFMCRPFREFANIRVNPNTVPRLPSPQELVDRVVTMHDLVYPQILERANVVRQRMRERINKRRKIVEQFPVGAEVLYRDPRRRAKAQPRWLGPYRVVDVRTSKKGTPMYQLMDNDVLLQRKFPQHQLRIVTAPRGSNHSDLAELYEVEKILNHNASNSLNIKYRIRWKGYGEEADTWEPANNIPEPVMIREYWREVNKRNRERIEREANEEEQE